MTAFRLFDAEMVRTHVPMKRAITLMGEAFAQLSAEEAQVPVRTHMHMPELGAQALFMPAFLGKSDQFGLKMVGMNDENPSKGLPFIHAWVMIFDACNGQPQALVDATFLTALRTGAGSGLATDLLANPSATKLAIFGAGVQAETQLEAVMAVRPIEKVWIFNRTKARAEKLASAAAEKWGIKAVVESRLEALKEVDIICTATTASAPLFEAKHIRPGTHINAIGAYRADMAEIPAELVAQSAVYVDQREACLVEAGDIIQTIEKGLMQETDIKAEIGEVVRNPSLGSFKPNGISLFKSVGNAAQDLIIASELNRKAELEDVGKKL